MGCDHFQEGLPACLEGAGDPETLAHLAACGACRQILEELNGTAGRLRELGGMLERIAVPPLSHRRPWIPFAAAAALLVGVGLWTLRDPAAPGPVQTAPALQVRRAAPGDLLEGPMQVVWESGALARLSPGARARLGIGQALTLLQGSLWARGCSVETAAGTFRPDPASECVLSLGESAAVFLMREALAVEASRLRLAVLAGQGTWTPRSGEALALKAGLELSVRDGTLRVGSVDRAWAGALQAPWKSGEEGLVRSGAEPLPGGGWRLEPRGGVARLGVRLPEGVWEAEIEPAGKSTLGVAFRARGVLRQWILTSGARRLRLQRWAGRISAEVDGVPAWSCPEEGAALERFPALAGEEDVGLLVWGEPVHVKGMRWQKVDMPVVLAGDAK